MNTSVYSHASMFVSRASFQFLAKIKAVLGRKKSIKNYVKGTFYKISTKSDAEKTFHENSTKSDFNETSLKNSIPHSLMQF